MSINQHERAFRTWPILVEIAQNNTTITYGDLAKRLGIHHRTIRYILELIQNYCLEVKLPPLTILIVNSTGRPGDGFVAYDLNDFDHGLEKVWNYNWKELKNPFDFSVEEESYEDLIKVLVNEPNCSEDVYTKVKSRGIKQIMFREALLRVYTERCAFTGISYVAGLEACHIVPWSIATNAEKIDVRNGILLNSFHHKLFDNGLITITTDYKIIFDPHNKYSGGYGKIEKDLTSNLSGQLMYRPHQKKHRPLAKYIVKHNEIVNE